MLEYHSMFLNSYSETPKFSLVSMVELTHDDTRNLYVADNDLYNYFVSNRRELDKSFVFFMSDHGPRFGQEARTSVNKEEQKNPFLYIVLPEHLRKSRIHEQLQANSKELVTNHDLHSTLKDILYVKFLFVVFFS
ncbi:unnamed protein product [Cylicostephanus goldi]|uniref:Sulfatase N-terminal domain-containing protein n=1 Tax=Cylicostephanus goldi TaxID=71465 RepID=A0A3P7NF37_CYLGO|nr:unnamed protein product [Cylicostephanus goldi]